MAILTSLAVEQPAPPARAEPAVPAGLSDLIMRLLAKDRDDRPPTAEEVAEALLRLQQPPARPPRRGRRWLYAAALALAALLLYPAAVTLPVRRVRQLGHAHETGVLGGIADLIADGSLVLGLLVLVCSVLIPLVKLLGLLLLSTRRIQVSARYRGRLWGLIEWTGRWGMLDVLLVAAVVAMMKIGEVVDIQPGPGVVLFAAVVILSLASAMVFDPRAMLIRQRGALR